MGINAISYNLSKWKGKLCSTCELFTSRKTAFIPAGRLVPSGGMPVVLKYFQQLGEPFSEAISDMLVFDALVCNQDRHLGNFGVLIDSHTNNIIASAPLFDHGLSLFPYAMEDDLKDISTYATAMRPATYPSFMAMTKEVITPRQKDQLRKLANFKFNKHSRYNLPKERLTIIEQFIKFRAGYYSGTLTAISRENRDGEAL